MSEIPHTAENDAPCPKRYSGNGHLGNPCVYCGYTRPIPPGEHGEQP